MSTARLVIAAVICTLLLSNVGSFLYGRARERRGWEWIVAAERSKGTRYEQRWNACVKESAHREAALRGESEYRCAHVTLETAPKALGGYRAVPYPADTEVCAFVWRYGTKL